VTDSPPSPFARVVTELALASIAGHITHTLALLPGWAGGILGGLVVHVIGRLLAPTLDAHGQRIKRSLSPTSSVPPPPKPDDHDVSG